MTTKLILFLIFFAASCGPREVKFPTNPEGISPYMVTNAERVQPQTDGVFLKQQTLNGSTITTGGKSYPFSEYSSNQALTWYANKPMGSSSQVLYRGEVVNGKLVVELIQDK